MRFRHTKKIGSWEAAFGSHVMPPPKHTSCNLLLAGFPLVKRRQLRNNFVAIPQKKLHWRATVAKNTTES